MGTAEQVFRATHGVPARVVSLAEQMHRSDVARYIDGSWLLPQELPDTLLLEDGGSALEARLARLSPDARSLGQQLSLHAGLATHELVAALSELPAMARVAALQELLAEGVLIGDEGGYRVQDALARQVLEDSLSPVELARSRARLGRFLLSAGALSVTDELGACVHALQAGSDPDLEARVSQIAEQLLFNAPDLLRTAAPAMEEALALFRARGREPHAQLRLLTALSVAGYFADRKLSVRYAEAALEALTQTLGLSLAQRLGRFAGKRLGLMIGLAAGAAGFAKRKKDRTVPAFPDAIRMFFNCTGALLGISITCADYATAERCVSSFEAWSGLGPKHFTSIICELGRALLTGLQDRPAEAARGLDACIAKLETQERALGMPEDARIRFLAGALQARGQLACLREDEEALAYAERLDALGPRLYKMSADYLRSLFYGHRGDPVLSEHHRARGELAAAQFGSAWQFEVARASYGLAVHTRTHDGAALKRTLEQLKRLSEEIPPEKPIEVRCRGAYLLARRKYAETVATLEGPYAEKPLALLGWARSNGTLASALNALGEHQRARVVCERALRALSPGDLEFHVMNLGLQIEHALSLAGAGESAPAARALEGLIAASASTAGPLTMGALHEARARVAMISGDAGAARAHLAEMERAYRGTEIPSLLGRCEAFARELARAFDAGPSNKDGQDKVGPGSGESSAAPFETIEAWLTDAAEGGTNWTEGALDVIFDGYPVQAAICKIDGARLVVCKASPDWTLSSEALAWLEERMHEGCSVEVTEAAQLDARLADPDILELGGTFYRAHWLRSGAVEQPDTVGVLVSRSEHEPAPPPREELLDAISRKLLMAS